MSPQNAANERTKLQGDVRFLRSLAWGQSASILALVLVVAFLLARERVIIMPPVVSNVYEIGAGRTNSEYQVDMARWVLDKLVTVTPESVEANNQEVLKIVDPEASADLRTELAAAAKRVKSDRITTIWVARTYTPQAENKVRVDGKVKTYISNQFTSDRDRSYLVSFNISFFGRLYVQAVEEIVDERRAR